MKPYCLCKAECPPGEQPQEAIGQFTGQRWHQERWIAFIGYLCLAHCEDELLFRRLKPKHVKMRITHETQNPTAGMER